MVILGSQNKITDFFMILAWASPFKVFLENAGVPAFALYYSVLQIAKYSICLLVNLHGRIDNMIWQKLSRMQVCNSCMSTQDIASIAQYFAIIKLICHCLYRKMISWSAYCNNVTMVTSKTFDIYH